MSTARLSLLEKFEAEFVGPSHVTGIEENNNNVNHDYENPETGLPSWVDRKLLQEGQHFIRNNFFSIFFAHFISLVFLLCYSPVRLILLRTGRSNTTAKALKRYVGTLVHIKAWYESDLLQQDYEGSDDISRIRVLHSRLARNLTKSQTTQKEESNNNFCEFDKVNQLLEAIRSDFNTAQVTPTYTTINDQKPAISQLDMCVTQFCFMGFLYLFPRSFGIHTSGLEGFVHVWALIGRRLGIQDEFNICLKRNFYTHGLILHQILLPDIGKLGADTIMLWTSLVSGISKFIPFISLKGILLFILRNILNSTSTLKLESLFSTYDNLCYKLMNRCFKRWISIWMVRWILNNLLRLAIFATLYLRFPNMNKTGNGQSISFHRF